MMNYWFTADWHYNHSNILKYCHRPFQDILEMNDVIIENTNRLVKSGDKLFILGDLTKDNPYTVINKLNCNNIYLIPGNHDYELKKKINHYRTGMYCRPGDYNKIKSIEYEYHLPINTRFISMSHYRMESWDKSHYKTWHLHGHHHGSLGQDIPGRRLDVGVDCWEYKPISFEEIEDLFSV